MNHLLVLVLACGALLISTEAQRDYNILSDPVKEAIKHGVKNAHRNTRQHMNFFAFEGHPKIADDYIEIEFLLKATNCEKLTLPDHRDDCVFMTNRPFINCRVCGKRSSNGLTDPSIDCAPQKKVNKDKRQTMCRRITGAGSPMSVKTAEKAEIDCPGCY